MTAILGISAFYHDSAAALVVDGRIVAAAQEERFTRKKHDQEFPSRAVEFCLQEAGLTTADIDYVGFYDKPLLKFERLLETYLAYAPAGFISFTKAMPVWLRGKLYLPREMRKHLGGNYRKRFIFTEHHESHAASAFFPSPFESAAILTIDGVGEWATATVGRGRGNRIELLHELRFPHSPGLLYSAFTYFCGFRVNSGEYKLMGLAPYGQPKYADLILEKLLDLKADGSFKMDMSYFNYCAGLTMTSPKFDRLFGGPPRKPESPVTEREMDLAASIQKVTEEIMLRMARFAQAETGEQNLCLAGGVALNCVGNGKILAEGPFENLWIQPAAGDAGGALGVAQFIWHQLLGKPREVDAGDSQRGSLLGPRFSDDDIRAYLDSSGAKYHYCDTDDALCDRVADLLANEKVVGWVQGRMEFGPRALGSRSILGDARSRQMQSVMNLKIKFRESFRPFAPAVLEERVDEYFLMRPREQSPYMLLVAPVQEDKRLATNGQADKLQGIEKLNLVRSVVPAITHVDHSARVQTVDERRHGRYYRLLKRFAEKTGCPVLINTSFNVGQSSALSNIGRQSSALSYMKRNHRGLDSNRSQPFAPESALVRPATGTVPGDYRRCRAVAVRRAGGGPGFVDRRRGDRGRVLCDPSPAEAAVPGLDVCRLSARLYHVVCHPGGDVLPRIHARGPVAEGAGPRSARSPVRSLGSELLDASSPAG